MIIDNTNFWGLLNAALPHLKRVVGNLGKDVECFPIVLAHQFDQGTNAGRSGKVKAGRAVANNGVYGMVCNPLCVEPSASATPGGRPRETEGNGG